MNYYNQKKKEKNNAKQNLTKPILYFYL